MVIQFASNICAWFFFLVLLRAKYRARRRAASALFRAFLRAAFLLAPGRDLRIAASCNLLAVDRNPFFDTWSGNS